jgi:hypothetical protein
LISRFAVFGISHSASLPISAYKSALEAVAASPLPAGPQAALPSHMAIYAQMASSSSGGSPSPASTPPGSLSLTTPQSAYLMRTASVSLGASSGSIGGGSSMGGGTNGPSSGRLGALSANMSGSIATTASINTPPGSQFSFAPFNNSPASSFAAPPLALPLPSSTSSQSMSQLPIVTEAHLQLLTQLLRQNKLFQMLDYELQQRVAMGLRYVALQPGQALYHEGDSYDSCYFVIGGILSEHSKDSIVIPNTDRDNKDGEGNDNKGKRRQSGKKNSRRRASRKGLGSSEGKDTNHTTAPTSVTSPPSNTNDGKVNPSSTTNDAPAAAAAPGENDHRSRRTGLSPDRRAALAASPSPLSSPDVQSPNGIGSLSVAIDGPAELSPMPQTTIKFAASPKAAGRELKDAPAKKFVFGAASGRDSMHQGPPTLERRGSMPRGMGAVLTALATPATPSRRASMRKLSNTDETPSTDTAAASASATPATAPTEGTGTPGHPSPPKDGSTGSATTHLGSRVPIHLRGPSSVSTSSFVANFLRPPQRLPPNALFGGKPLDVAAKADTKTRYGTCRRLHTIGSFFGLPSSPKLIGRGHVNTVMALETSVVARLDCAFLRLMVNSPIIQGYNTIRSIVKHPPGSHTYPAPARHSFSSNLLFVDVNR